MVGEHPSRRAVGTLDIGQARVDLVLEVGPLKVAHEHVEREGLAETLRRGVAVLLVGRDPSFCDGTVHQLIISMTEIRCPSDDQSRVEQDKKHERLTSKAGRTR